MNYSHGECVVCFLREDENKIINNHKSLCSRCIEEYGDNISSRFLHILTMNRSIDSETCNFCKKYRIITFSVSLCHKCETENNPIHKPQYHIVKEFVNRINLTFQFLSSKGKYNQMVKFNDVTFGDLQDEDVTDKLIKYGFTDFYDENDEFNWKFPTGENFHQFMDFKVPNIVIRDDRGHNITNNTVGNFVSKFFSKPSKLAFHFLNQEVNLFFIPSEQIKIFVPPIVFSLPIVAPAILPIVTPAILPIVTQAIVISIPICRYF